MKREPKAKVAIVLAMLALGVAMAPAASANFTSANYPATITGTSSEETFALFGTFIDCTNNSFSGTLAAASSSLTVLPTYKNCTAGAGFPTTVKMRSCDFLLQTTTGSPQASITCSTSGDWIEIAIYASHAAHTSGTPICHMLVPSQGPVTGFSYTNNANGTVTVSGELTNLFAVQSRTSFVCPAGNSTATGEYWFQVGGVVFSGNKGAFSAH